MTDTDCDELVAQMAAQPEIEVELRDEIAHGISNSGAVANEGAHARAAAISNGERTYHVFHKGTEVRGGIANRDQVQRLIRAGAVWTGPEHNRPANAIPSPGYREAVQALQAGKPHVFMYMAGADGKQPHVGVGLATLMEHEPPPRVTGGPIKNAEARALQLRGVLIEGQ